MKRIVSYDTVLGIHGHDAFHLTKGEEIEVLEIDVYSRAKVIIQGQEVVVYVTTLDRIA